MIAKKHKYPLMLVIFGIGFLVSAILTFMPSPEICDPDEGCDVVLTSEYSDFLGIKNSVYGLFVFLILIFATLIHMKSPKRSSRHVIHFGTIVGTGVSLIFLYIQTFVLKEFCKYCLVVDLSIILGLLIILIFWKE